jgi:hypothetical protein
MPSWSTVQTIMTHHVGRLFAARAIAEELILPQRVLPEAELAADDDQGDVKPECEERQWSWTATTRR